MVSQSRVSPVAGVWVLVLATSLLLQDSLVSASSDQGPNIYKLWRGTQREFTHYSCKAEFHKDNREHYSVLRDLCEDCQNVHRDSIVFQPCMSNCFFNNMFLLCVKRLLRSDSLEDYLERRNEIKE